MGGELLLLPLPLLQLLRQLPLSQLLDCCRCAWLPPLRVLQGRSVLRSVLLPLSQLLGGCVWLLPCGHGGCCSDCCCCAREPLPLPQQLCGCCGGCAHLLLLLPPPPPPPPLLLRARWNFVTKVMKCAVTNFICLLKNN